MYRSRWEQLIENRDSLPFVEIASWNDYGESHVSFIGCELLGVLLNPAAFSILDHWLAVFQRASIMSLVRIFIHCALYLPLIFVLICLSAQNDHLGTQRTQLLRRPLS